MRWRLGPLFAFALLWGCFANPCSKPFTPPPDDACAGEDTSGTADALLIGPATTSDGDPFVPYHDGDVAQTVHGGQGATMLPVRLHVTGAAAPKCLAQMTEVFGVETGSMDEQIGNDDTALRTYPDGDGRSTHAAYIILSFGIPGSLRVTSTAGGQSLSLQLGNLGPLDLAMPVDGPPADDLAQPPDAAAPLDLAAPPDAAAD